MRPPLLLAVATIALVMTTGCWLEADDAGGSDEERSELRDYAASMRVWWLEVYGGEISLDVPSLAVDHSRIREDPAVGYFGSNPLPSVEPPYSMDVLHEMLVNTVIALVRAEDDADLQGYFAGVAAAFCDPRDAEEGGGDYLLRHAAPLQTWRWSGEPCHEGQTWAGVYRKTGDPWRDFQWGCRLSSLDTDILEFRVSDIDLKRACLNALRWSRAFDSTTRLWSAGLIRLCGGQLEVWRIPDPADALAACE